MKISFTKLPNFKNSNFVFILDILDHFIPFISLSSLGRGVLLTFLALKKKIFIATYALILYTLSIQLFYFSPNNLSVSTDILVFNKLVRMDDADKATNTMDMPFRFYPCFAAGLAYYIAIKKAPERVVMLKQMYEEEFERAMSQDEDRASFRISPYKPGL